METYFKKSLVFFSETTEPLIIKLSWNVPWMVGYKMCVFLLIRSPRWWPPQGSFNIRTYEKMKKDIFLRYQKIRLNRNGLWIIIYFVCVDGRHHRTLFNHGNMNKLFSVNTDGFDPEQGMNQVNDTSSGEPPVLYPMPMCRHMLRQTISRIYQVDDVASSQPLV